MAAVTSGRVESSGVPSGKSYNSKFYISWSRSSSSETANTSTISWSVGWIGSGGPWWSSNAIKIKSGSIGADKISTGTWSNQSGDGDHELRSGSTTIQHNSDGTGSFSASVTGWFYDEGDLTVSGSWDLPTIARASTAKLSATSVGIGSEQTVTITRASTSFTHDITWKIGNTEIGSHSGVTTSQKFTIPTTAAAAIPSATSGTCTVTVTTKSGSTVIGSTTLTFTVTIPDSDTYKPSFTATLSRVDNDVPTGWALAVQGHSKAKVDLSSAKAGSGASLTSWSVTGPTYSGGGTLTTMTATFTTPDVLKVSGTLSVTVTVTDTRGRSTSKTVTMEVKPWTPPTITPAAIYRVNASGTQTFNGTYASIQATWTYASVGNNAPTIKLEYKTTTATSWTALTTPTLASGTRATIGGGKLAATSSYHVRVSVTDTLGGTASTTWNLGPAQVDLDFRADANGMGIGGVGETAGALDIWWPASLRKGIRPTALGSSEDLNDCRGYGTPIWYQQCVNANCSTERNYPENYAGLLQSISITDSNFCYQTYFTYGSTNRVWHRTYYNGTWYPWKLSLDGTTDWDTTLPDLGSVKDGWTVTANRCRRRNGMATLTVTVTPDTALSTGNIANITLFTIPSGFRPKENFTTIVEDVGGILFIGSNGDVQLNAVMYPWSAGTARGLRLQYFLP